MQSYDRYVPWDASLQGISCLPMSVHFKIVVAVEYNGGHNSENQNEFGYSSIRIWVGTEYT